MLIKLKYASTNETYYLNPRYIITIQSDSTIHESGLKVAATEIITQESREHVVETPEEILKLIEEAGKPAFSIVKESTITGSEIGLQVVNQCCHRDASK